MKAASASAAVLCAVLAATPVLLFAQGSLIPPPGPPAATMKTLDQIEPRTAINAASTPGDADSLFKITQPGSYYLTGNVTGVSGKSGIEIAASGVSLDLNGFELTGGAGSLDGVRVSIAVTDVVIQNGSARSWGQDGIDCGLASGARLLELAAASNTGRGIATGADTIVYRCTAYENGAQGISGGSGCVIQKSTARNNGTHGFAFSTYTAVLNCSAGANGGTGVSLSTAGIVLESVASDNSSLGIDMAGSSLVARCTARSNGSDGIDGGSGSMVFGCTTRLNQGDGIQVSSNSYALENHCHNNGNSTTSGAGVHATSNSNRIEANSTRINYGGIDVDGVGNLVIRNSGADNLGAEFGIAAGNTAGPTVTSASGSNPNANYDHTAAP